MLHNYVEPKVNKQLDNKLKIHLYAIYLKEGFLILKEGFKTYIHANKISENLTVIKICYKIMSINETIYSDI